MTRIWFDTEFIENGRTIELVSIGAVDENGDQFYAEVDRSGVDLDAGDDWFQANVRPHLIGGDALMSRALIAREFHTFAGPEPEFHAYYADYDWVVLCQLYGRMVDLPKGWPMFCRDIQQTRVELGIKNLPEMRGNAHNALDDALWVKEAWEFLEARRRHVPLTYKEIDAWLSVYEPPDGTLAGQTIGRALSGFENDEFYICYLTGDYRDRIRQAWASGEIPREPPK